MPEAHPRVPPEESDEEVTKGRMGFLEHLDELRKVKPDKLVRRRREKFLGMGRFSED